MPMPTPTLKELCEKYINHKALVTVLRHVKHERKIRDGSVIAVPATLGVQMAVDILDMRINWGNIQCLIRPLHGAGSTWVTVEREGQVSRLTLVEEWPDENQADESGGPADEALGSGS